MPHIKKSFAPVSNTDAKVLILGSMPGQYSLSEQEYYAHPQNAFWKIMDKLVGTKSEPSYEDRLDALLVSGIALWDVLDSCKRKGSMDSDIKNEIANDFAAFFAQHPHITHVFFNGAKAEQSFEKFVLHQQNLPPLQRQRLPSTSPAHARINPEEKLKIWRKELLKAGIKLNY
jgi:TDG/mug DNA glycosylase family protein